MISVHLLRNMDRVLTNGLIKVNRVQALWPEMGMKTVAGIFALAFALVCAAPLFGGEEPKHLEVVDFSKLIPILPDAPSDWTADKAEGTTDDAGGAAYRLTNRARARASHGRAVRPDRQKMHGEAIEELRFA